MDLCTIATPRNRATVRALCESWVQRADGAAWVLWLGAGTIDDLPPGVRVVSPIAVLGKDHAHRIGAHLNAERFALSVMPAWLLYVRAASTAGHVLYLAGGKLVLDDPSTLGDQCAGRSYLAAANVPSPLEFDGARPDPIEAAHAILDDGLVVVGPGSDGFLAWWQDCLDPATTFDVRGAWHRDHDWLAAPWLDAAIGAFDPIILRSPTTQFSRFADPQLDPTSDGDRLVDQDGEPIMLCDLRCYSPEKPFLFDATSGAIPRVLLSEHPALRSLVEAYDTALRDAGWSKGITNKGWLFGSFPSGAVLNDVMRATFYKGHVFATNFGEEAPPDPFTEEVDFVAWLRRSRRTNDERGVSRYLQTLWECRPDLQAAMPELDQSAASAAALVAWAQTAQPDELDIPERLRPAEHAHHPTDAAESLRAGVNIAGFLSAAKGLGEAGRAVLAATSDAGIEHCAYDFGHTPARKEHLDAVASSGPDHPFDTNIICINAEMMMSFAEAVGPEYFAGRRNIGVWFWEAGTLNDRAKGGIDLVDEIWVTAPYVADVFRAETDAPIFVMPLPVTAPPPSSATRGELGVPEGFMFLFVYDFFSTIERKNPVGLVKAFARAFAPNEGPILVLKSINGDKNRAKMEEVRAAVGDRTDVIIMDEFLTAENKSALINLCDCYVSLHRGEGFGLGMAEAMTLGKPVIGTGYSGNLAFMNKENSFLVDFELTEITDNDGLYPPGGAWAEPVVDDAARLMRIVHDNPELAGARADRGRRDVEHQLHPARLAEFVSQRLTEIREGDLSTAAALTSTDVARVKDQLDPLEIPRERSRPRNFAARVYWKFAGPLFQRMDGYASHRDNAVHADVQALHGSLVELREALEELRGDVHVWSEADAARDEIILLHSNSASEYARVAAFRGAAPDPHSE